jgi:hypothetical protein
MIPAIRPGPAGVAAALARLAAEAAHWLIDRVLERLADVFVDPW